MLVNCLLAADDFRNRANKIVECQFRNFELVEKFEDHLFANEYLAAVHNTLQSGLDAFFSLRLLALPDVLEKREDLDLGRLNVTINGWANLFRQSLECLAISHFLLSRSTQEEVTKYGFAYCFKDSEEKVKFMTALRGASFNEAKMSHKKLSQIGEIHNLITVANPKGRNVPNTTIPDTQSLLRGLSIPTNFSKDIIALHGQGIENAEWLYVWLSGFTHGRSWMHPDEDLSEGRLNFEIRNPDLLKLGHALAYVVFLANDCLETLASDFKDIN